MLEEVSGRKKGKKKGEDNVTVKAVTNFEKKVENSL